ncbi:MAG: DUF4405 domain-containing protein [Christensenellales bacterium]
METAAKKEKQLKSNVFLKIFLDIVLMAAFILLMNSKTISMAFHEIAGIAIGIIFLVHKLLNWAWIKSVTKNIFARKVTALTRIRYILDVLLLLSVYTIIISGLFMSKALLPAAETISIAWKSIHTSLSYLCILLIGLHIGLHWKWVMNGFSRMFRIRNKSVLRKWLLRAAALALAVWGVFNTMNAGVFTNIAMVFSSPGISGSQSINFNSDSIPGDLNTLTADGSQQAALPESLPQGSGKGIDVAGESQGGFPQNGNAKGHKAEGSSDVFSILLTFAPIVGLFGIIGYLPDRLCGRKKAVRKSNECGAKNTII